MTMAKASRTLLKPGSWPAGQRAALAVFVDFEPEDPPWMTNSPLSNSSVADRLLHTLTDLDIIPTIIIDPDSDEVFNLSSPQECDAAIHVFEAPTDLSHAKSVSQARLGRPPDGFVLLTGAPSPPLEKQDVWIMDGSGAAFPERTANGKTIIPYSPWWHDGVWLSPLRPSPPSAFLEHLTVSLASVRARGELMTLMLTAQYSGQPGYVETVQRFLDEVIAAGDVWITNGTGIRRHVEQAAT
jgi:hypothetical protein